VGVAEAGNALLTATRKERHMSKMDEAKGRAKRAAGELTGDDGMKREGSVDKAAGKAKRAVDKGAGEIKERIDR
jgi:uncharacterized protein YjbJ (UPF0337 family)